MKLSQIAKYRHFDTDSTEDRQLKENKFKINFGHNLQKYLSDSNVKIDTLASGIGYDRQHLYGICGGKKAPSLFCLWRICDYLNISSEYLYGIDNNIVAEKSNENSIEAKKQILIDKIKNLDDIRIVENLINNLDFTSDILKVKSEDPYDSKYL